MTMIAPEVGAATSAQPPTRAPNLPPPPSAWRRAGRSLATFARRSPMSAFWGLVAGLGALGIDALVRRVRGR